MCRGLQAFVLLPFHSVMAGVGTRRQLLRPMERVLPKPKPETRNTKSKIQNPKPEIQNLKLESPKPETRNPKSEIQNLGPKPRKRNLEPESEIRSLDLEATTADRQNPQPQTLNPEPKTLNPEPQVRSARVLRRDDLSAPRGRSCSFVDRWGVIDRRGPVPGGSGFVRRDIFFVCECALSGLKWLRP